MAYQAKIWKKLRKWLGSKLDLQMRVTYPKSEISKQVGKLMQRGGKELVTMTTL